MRTFTPAQLDLIPVQVRTQVIERIQKGVKVSKVLGKFNVILGEEQIDMLIADVTELQIATTEVEINEIYATETIAVSCMTKNDTPGKFYPQFGAQLAYLKKARAVINPISKTFCKVYGDNAKTLRSILKALGYTSNYSYLAGLSCKKTSAITTTYLDGSNYVYYNITKGEFQITGRHEDFNSINGPDKDFRVFITS